MKYVLTGSTGNITKPVAIKLIEAGHDVSIITSSEAKKQAIESLGARALVGTIEDREFLSKSFAGADVVYTMVPPKWDPKDWKEYIGSIGANYASAIKSAGVKKVVNLSSVGADLDSGCGPVSGLHRVENELNALPGVDVKHLRPGYFYNSLLSEGQYISAGSPLAHFGIQLENGHWPPHLHFQVIIDIGVSIGDYPGVCRVSEREKYLANSPDPSMLLNFK